MICVNKDDPSTTVFVVSRKGFGKRTAIDEYRITNRGGKGVKTIKVTDKTGPLIGILDVTEKEDLMITCKSGVTIRTSIANIREVGRATQGVKLIKLDDGDEIAAITKLSELEDDDELIETVAGDPIHVITEGIDTTNIPEDTSVNQPESSAEDVNDDISEEK